MNLLCVDHLTAPEQLELPAVTIFNGFAVCAHCARSRKSNLDKMAASLKDSRPTWK
jgi:hypothetical protein